MGKNRLWTEQEELLLARNYGNLPTAEIAKQLHRDPRTVKHKAFRMGLKDKCKLGRPHQKPQKPSPPKPSRIKPWTEQEDEFLLANRNLANEELADRLGRSKVQVMTRRGELRKSNLSSIEAESFKEALKKEAQRDDAILANWRPLRRPNDEFFTVHTRHGDHW